MSRIVTHIVAFAILAIAFVLPASAQWKEAAIPAPFNSGYYLDVFFMPGNPNLGWACSIEGFVVRTTDGGTIWRGTSVPNSNLEYIQFLTPQIGYASGPSGVYRSDDGGANWRDISPYDPNFEKGWGSYWINQNEGIYFVGGCASGLQAFYRTTDGGDSWSVSFGSEPLSGLSDGIIFRDGSGFAVSSGVLWRTTNFGRSWSWYSSTGSKIWTEEIAISGSSFLLPTSGADCDGQTRGRGSMRFSNDGGLSWIERQTGANMFGSFLLDSRRGWGVGDARTVIYTQDQGNTWVLRNCGIRGNIDDCWFINDTLGWAVGDGIYRSNFNAPGKTVSISPPDDVLTICSGDSVFVEASGSFTSYSWEDGTNAQGRFLSEPGRYIVTAFDASTCLTSSDTVRVVLKSAYVPKITASAKKVCEGDSVILLVDGPVVSWSWSTGETTPSVVVRQSGTYTCTTLDSNGCTKSAQTTITVNALPLPVIQANRSLTICLDDVITLSAQSGFRYYEWNTGETTQSITTGTGGKYWVTVTDAEGCVGTSDTVRVIALATRNKANVQFSASDGGTIVIQDHDVGEIACRTIRIRNVSPSESLVIGRPFIVGNVFFSIPQSQLPVVIPAGDVGEILICASAIDSGLVEDTLALPDTCSVAKIPLRSRGLSIQFGGTSRCNVDVSSLVYSAGSSWRLSAPFPVPASRTLTITAKRVSGPDAGIQAVLRDVTGRVICSAQAFSAVDTEVDVILDVSGIATGPYILCLESEGQTVSAKPVAIGPQ